MMFELDKEVGTKIVETCNEITLSTINVRLGLFTGDSKIIMENHIVKKKQDLKELYQEQKRLRELK